MFDCSRTLGDAVKQSREKLGMTQMQLATYLGVDPRTILNINNKYTKLCVTNVLQKRVNQK